MKPEQMITAYAIVVGAHFLPYSWLYDSLTYRIVAILVPLLAFVLAIAHMTLFIPVMVIVVEIIMLFVFITPKSESCDK